MYKSLIYSVILILSFYMLSCQNKQQADQVKETYKGRYNYAVVWHWETMDKEHVLSSLTKQAQELNDLWEKDIVENIYLNPDAEFSTGEQFPDISFIIKAKDKQAAKVYLDNMLFVKNRISSYTLYRVGQKYLGRNTDALNVIGTKKSFAAVFNTQGSKDDILKNLQKQNDKTLELWQTGQIENAYLDIEGYSSGKSFIPSMVYYVNADDEESAHIILNELPFVKNKLTSYQLFPVGVFWMGQYESPGTK